MNKDKVIVIRVDEKTKRRIKNKADKLGLNMSEYVIKQCISKKLIINEYDKNLMIAANRVGTNINQAVRILNTYHNIEERDYQYLREEFNEFKRLVFAFLNSKTTTKY